MSGHLSFNLAVPLLGIYLEDTPLIIRKYICIRLFIATVLAIANTRNFLNVQAWRVFEKIMVHIPTGSLGS